MIGIRYEDYNGDALALPFVLHVGLEKNLYNLSAEQNWHENIELQLCTRGSGVVLLNGERLEFAVGDIIVVNSNVLHYTNTSDNLTYTCLIVGTDFCKHYGIDYDAVTFRSHIKDEGLAKLISELEAVCSDEGDPLMKARATAILLKILIELATNHAERATAATVGGKAFDSVKKAIVFIKQNYSNRLTLDRIAKEILLDKYTLCREFKRFTGETVIENLTRYRCQMAVEHLQNGASVAEAAHSCGFENLSFFTKTFKKVLGKLPSELKKR